MLKHLKIKNFAIIDAVEIEFGEGLNIISGETGAGKSILMDALSLILGGRASSNLIRAGEEEASVEALFAVQRDERILKTLEQIGITVDEDELIVRRVVHSSGKNRIYVNGCMVNMSTLQSITSSLVDLCSQHDQQLLSSGEEQLLWVDRFGKLEKHRARVRSLYLEWKERHRALECLSSDSAQREQRMDFLRFQIQELEEASLGTPDEDTRLEQELKALENTEALFSFAAASEAIFYGSDSGDRHSILEEVSSLLHKASSLSSVDPRLSQAVDFLQTIKLNAEELAHFIRSYSSGISRDEDRIESINARLALLSKYKKKYGPSLAAVKESLENFKRELSVLENHDSSLEKAKSELESKQAELWSAAEALSKARKKASAEFSSLVVGELADLQMDRARFLAEHSVLNQASISGVDQIRFLIATNPGEPMYPLSKVASGGELSRVMLAMHNVVSSRGGVGVYLFDEVDTGIGGNTAVTVGRKLQRVSRNNQVICITHLPQVAAFANHHFRVEKRVERKSGSERTICAVIRLSKQERELEIGRMLGGMGNDKAALANARAMLAKAENGRVASDREKKRPTEKRA